MELTQEALKELMDYSPETGEFTWKVQRSGTVGKGTQAGSIKDTGYRVVSVLGHKVLEHRLAYLWMTGALPTIDVDHIDGCRSNNAWANLRLLTHAQNCSHRQQLNKNSSSGFPGASFYPRSGKWRSQLMVAGKQHWLGHFDTPELANAAYLSAQQTLQSSSTKQLPL